MTIEASTDFQRPDDGAVYAADHDVYGDGSNGLPGILDAMAEASAKAGGGPGKVILPPGDIGISGGDLPFSGDMIIEGVSSDATRLLFDAGSTVKVGGAGETTLRGRLKDLTLDGQYQADYGLTCGDQNATPQTGSLIVEQVKIRGFEEAAIWSAQTAFLFLNNVDCFLNNNGAGLLTDTQLTGSGQTTTIRAIGCRFERNLYGAKIHQLVAGTFFACSFEENEREGFLHEIAVGGAAGQPNRAVWLDHCYFEDNVQENGYPGAQLAWRSPGSGLIQQINVRNPFFSTAATHWNAANPLNIEAGTGFATIDYPEQTTGFSRALDETGVYLHVKDRYAPTHANWDWDSSTGLARINHEVWADPDEWQRWTNSPAGAVMVDGYGLNTGAPTVPVVTTSGTTASRPAPAVGASYFDTDLGYRIDGDGAQWVNSAGVAV